MLDPRFDAPPDSSPLAPPAAAARRSGEAGSPLRAGQVPGDWTPPSLLLGGSPALGSDVPLLTGGGCAIRSSSVPHPIPLHPPGLLCTVPSFCNSFPKETLRTPLTPRQGSLWSVLPALRMQAGGAPHGRRPPSASPPAPAPFPPQPQPQPARWKHTGHAVCKDDSPSHHPPRPSQVWEHASSMEGRAIHPSCLLTDTGDPVTAGSQSCGRTQLCAGHLLWTRPAPSDGCPPSFPPPAPPVLVIALPLLVSDRR